MYTVNSYKSPADDRDLKLSKLIVIKDLPKRSFHKKLKIKDQGSFGACVGFSSSTTREKDLPDNKEVILSPSFIYTECKKIDGIPNQEGTYPRVAMKILKEKGICLESTLPYDADAMKKALPFITKKMYQEALNYKIDVYTALDSIEEIKYALTKKPILAGVFVTDSFMYPEKGGFIGLPEGTFYGGHAICIDGYDDEMVHTYKNGKTFKGFLRIPNSWSEKWGDEGYGWLPYDFLNFKTDIGMTFFSEAWAGLSMDDIEIDIEKEIEQQKETLVLWINKKEALINGKTFELNQEPIRDKTTWRTLIPLRQICELFNKQVDWHSNDNSITIGNDIKLWIDKNIAEVRGKTVILDQPPYIDPNTWRTLIPLRFVSEYLGYQVDYIKSEEKIIITK